MTGPDFSLVGRRAFVTGSTGGIGHAIAQALASAGAEVITHGRSGGADAAGPSLRVADLSDPAALEALIASLPPIDILVSNVAVQHRQPVDAIAEGAIDEQVAANLKAPLRLIQAVLPHMRAGQWGRILMIGSVQQWVPHPEMLVYAALKAAQANMVQNLARQIGPDGVTINVLAPGVVVTARNQAVLADPAYAARVQAQIPAGYFGTAQDMAGAALLLCSNAGRYINGVNLPVDGGMHL
jgi:NAD(P)-dependent dehydrogenase (short-subunit alcohol dehydrogenase family)